MVSVADTFSAAFYQRLFDAHPALRSIFPVDLDEQQRKLVDELAFIVDNLGQLPSLVERAAELGRRHREYGVEPSHYEEMLDVFMSALRSVLGDQVTVEVDTAWRLAYRLASELMMQGAKAPPPAIDNFD